MEELGRERAKLREEMTRLRRAQTETRPTEVPSLTFEAFVKTVVRWAKRLPTRQDNHALREDITAMLAGTYWKGQSITAFRFQPAFLAALRPEHAAELKHTIHLEKPFRTTPDVPKSFRACSRFDEVKPESTYPKKRGQCQPCYKQAQKEKRERVKRQPR